MNHAPTFPSYTIKEIKNITKRLEFKNKNVIFAKI